MKQIKELFEKWIQHGFSPYDVFDDFLRISVISLINLNKNNPEFEENEKEFQRIAKKYDGDIEMFSKILSCFVDKMETTKDTLKDWIWEYFMQEISHGEHWQFFTPDHIAWFIADATIKEKNFPSLYGLCVLKFKVITTSAKKKALKILRSGYCSIDLISFLSR